MNIQKVPRGRSLDHRLSCLKTRVARAQNQEDQCKGKIGSSQGTEQQTPEFELYPKYKEVFGMVIS